MKNISFNSVLIQHHIAQRGQPVTSRSNNDTMQVAKKILAEVMVFRRTLNTDNKCEKINCVKCTSPHLEKIISAVTQRKPITFVLPAFPGKSPNLEKVLGHLPDYGEQLALDFLSALCQKIKSIYTPGSEMIVCSDGRVFSDVVGMNESHVTAYQVELSRLIKQNSLKHISTFNLDDAYSALSFNQMREQLMNKYGQTLDALKLKVRNGAKSSATPTEQDANRMYCGITRFLFEDAMHANQLKSRTAIQKEAKAKAYEVIRRSNAWSQLIASYYPDAVRLSIHPQSCESDKLGIRLVGQETWMTPWHGVAVESKKGYFLLKRKEAEKLGAKLVYATNGQPSHYQY